MNKCNNCGKETSNPKYCSSSCSAKVNNKIPKRIAKKRYCKHCGTEIPGRFTICEDCRPGKDMTLEEASYGHLHLSSAYAKIRNRARKILKHLPKKCSNCGYDKHVEVCHIKPISSFDLSTLVSVINDESNLAVLCPNCHWELDHGFLSS